MVHEMTERLVRGETHSDIINWMTAQKGIVPQIVSYVFSGKDRETDTVKGRYREAAESEIQEIKKEFSIKFHISFESSHDVTWISFEIFRVSKPMEIR